MHCSLYAISNYSRELIFIRTWPHVCHDKILGSQVLCVECEGELLVLALTHMVQAWMKSLVLVVMVGHKKALWRKERVAGDGGGVGPLEDFGTEGGVYVEMT